MPEPDLSDDADAVWERYRRLLRSANPPADAGEVDAAPPKAPVDSDPDDIDLEGLVILLRAAVGQTESRSTCGACAPTPKATSKSCSSRTAASTKSAKTPLLHFARLNFPEKVAINRMLMCVPDYPDRFAYPEHELTAFAPAERYVPVVRGNHFTASYRPVGRRRRTRSEPPGRRSAPRPHYQGFRS